MNNLRQVIYYAFLIFLGHPSCGAHQSPREFLYYTKEQFCTGQFQMKVNPTFIPALFSYLQYCSRKAYEQDGVIRKRALQFLFNVATPVIHRAFFDSKTSVKDVLQFTKMKITVEERFGHVNALILQKGGLHNFKGQLLYSPGNDDGSYNLAEDLEYCQKILNLDPLVELNNIARESQLPKFCEGDNAILFPPFNLTMPALCSDSTHVILDLYVLIMRCLSFTELSSAMISTVSERIIMHLKKNIMPHINAQDFEKAYADIVAIIAVCTTECPPRVNSVTPDNNGMDESDQPPESDDDSPNQIPKTPMEEFPKMPSEMEAQCSTDYQFNLEDSIGLLVRTTVSDMMTPPEMDSVSVESTTNVTVQESCEFITECSPKFQFSGENNLMIIVYAVLACLVLLLVLYCLICGCSESNNDMPSSEYCDEYVDEYLKKYLARAMDSENNRGRCFCTLKDSKQKSTKQLDVIVGLHRRCDELSKNIRNVAMEIAGHDVVEQQISIESLRNYVRNVSMDLVDEDEMVRRMQTSRPRDTGKHILSYS